MGAELLQVLLLRRIGGIVPVADVHEFELRIRLLLRPAHHARHRPFVRNFTHQPPRFLEPDVQQIRQRVVAPHGCHEIVLQALRDECGGGGHGYERFKISQLKQILTMRDI